MDLTPNELSIICSALAEYRNLQYKIANRQGFYYGAVAKNHCFAVAAQTKKIAEKVSEEILKF